MKTCPICKARCFDDMEICYGCMHRFEPEPEARPVPIGDVTGIEDLPLRASARRPAEAAASKREGAASRGSRREGPRVFGAREDEEPARIACADAAASEIRTSKLEPVVGPIASASLGDGYRLVVSIERV